MFEECDVTTIDRTAYPRFKRVISEQDLTEIYTLSQDEQDFIAASVYGPQMQLNLALLLKSCQRLAYFPPVQQIPVRIVNHLRQQLPIPYDTPVGYDWDRTRYRHHQLIRDYLAVVPYSQGGRQIVINSIQQAIQTMMYPADLINAAIEALVRQSVLLPAFSTLNSLATQIRNQTHHQFFAQVHQQLTADDLAQLAGMLQLPAVDNNTHFTTLKQATGRLTRANIDLTTQQLRDLEPLRHLMRYLQVLPPAKIGMFAAEAQALEVGDMLDTQLEKRTTLLLCFLHEAQTRLRDDLAHLLVKRMDKVRHKAQTTLEKIKFEQRDMRERFIDLFAHIIHLTRQTDDDTLLGGSVRSLIDQAGGADILWQDYEAMLAYHQDNYLPLVWRHYKVHRRSLFDLVQAIDIRSTTQEQQLVEALTFITDHRDLKRERLPTEIDLRFLSQRWQQLVVEHTDGQTWLNRRHLEAAIFTYVASELKTGDLCVLESQDYADYRDQLLPWEACQPHIEDYCTALGLEPTPDGFVQQLRGQLRDAIQSFDVAFPDNDTLMLKTDGSLILKRLTEQQKPAGLKTLEYQLHQRMPNRQVLDILCRVHHWLPFTRYFGPPSGSQPKMPDADARYLLTIFGYGCNLGAKQTAQHARLPVTARVLRRINLQHISLDRLDQAIRETINQYRRFDLPAFWGTGTTAAADGTHFDLYRNNLLAERHVRYGGYGGIAYHHIADTYVALFSHFIQVGVWEAVYIFDGLLKNTSEIQPDTLHADTHGQSEPVFGLAHLLGIQLMPRIRNWKKRILYRATADDQYAHVDALFTGVIDWHLIRTHWQDLMQVIISIQQGQVLPSMLLRKLRYDSRKNRLYRAFRELGRVIRTRFLLQYIANPALRRQVHSVTNQVEAYNRFSKWLFFGDEGRIKHNDPIEQEKRIKYNDLVANLVMLHNVMDMTRILRQLQQEGYPVNRAILARISPYLTEHVRRFGEYILDLSQVPEPLIFELPVPDEGAP